MKLPKNIIDIILSNKTSLGDNPALPPELEDKFLVFLVSKYYVKISSNFDGSDIEELSRTMSSLLTKSVKLESENRQALEQLCTQLINDIFHIPNDTLIVKAKIVPKVDTKQLRLVPESSEGYTFDSIDDINRLTSEIYKRRMLNVLITGAAMYYTEKISSYQDDLNKINSELPRSYSTILSLNDYLLFHTLECQGTKHTDGGKVDVYLSDPYTPVTINAEGINFPSLLMETIKGLLELSIAHGLPDNQEKAQFITGKTDFKLAEIWDQRLGLPLWERIVNIFKAIDEEPIEVGLNFIFMELSTMTPKIFNASMQEILAGTNAGRKIAKKICDKIHYQKERDEFDDYMSSEHDDLPLNDGNFTSNELINDDLCASITLDEEA